MGVRRKEKGDEAETGATPQGHLEEPLIHLFLLPPVEWGGADATGPRHLRCMTIGVRAWPLWSGHTH